MADPAADPMPQAPTLPEDDMCCNSGCERCVWTIWQEEMDAWRVALARWQQRHEQPQQGEDRGKH